MLPRIARKREPHVAGISEPPPREIQYHGVKVALFAPNCLNEVLSSLYLHHGASFRFRQSPDPAGDKLAYPQ